MIAWYRQQAKEHGLVPATRWFARVLWALTAARISNKLLSPKVACPCCGWEGRRFLDYIEVGYRVNQTACPRCDSHSRHRAMFLWLKNEFQLSARAGNALVFAPEKALAPLWQSARNLKVHKIDIVPARGVNVLADIMSLPFPNDSVDLIWCHHVLDQVADDRVALVELRRVLRTRDSVVLVSVGMSELGVTQEFGFADKALTGNWRTYGSDFIARLQDAGLEARPVTHNLSNSQCKHFGIHPEVFFYCTRKV